MTCKNCGAPINEKPKRNIFKKILATLLIVALCLVALFTGIEIGVNHSKSLPESPDFIKMISTAIASLPGIPFSIELDQEKLNGIILQNEESLAPLSGAKLTISKDQTLILTGNVDKNKIQEIFPTEIPSYIGIFLPETVSLYIETVFPETDDGNIAIELKNVTIAGITFSQDFTESLGINSLVSEIITDIIETKQPPYYKISGIRMGKSKNSDENVLIISGKIDLTQN